MKSLVRSAIRNVGFDLVRYHPDYSEDARFHFMLSQHKINLIFDIGANIGQFGRRMRKIGYQGRIVSFEPLTEAWNELERVSTGDALWDVAPRGAIGSEDGEIEMNVAGNSVSSSILNMLASHVDAAPESRFLSTERVPIRRLDSIGNPYLQTDSVHFIKIDTQGFEGQVLQGAPELLNSAVGLDLEISLVPLYEGQLLFDSLIDYLKELGFEIWDLELGFRDPRTRRLLQADAIFYRN